MATQDRSVSIAPYFKIHSGKMQEVKALCERFVEKSKTEPGCLYYGFSFNGDIMFCREGYQDADAALAHLQNVGPLLAEFQKLTEDRKSTRLNSSHTVISYAVFCLKKKKQKKIEKLHE